MDQYNNKIFSAHRKLYCNILEYDDYIYMQYALVHFLSIEVLTIKCWIS